MYTVKFILATFLAYYIHSSCLIFMLFTLIPIIKRLGSRKTLLLAFIFCGIIIFGSQDVLSIISVAIPEYKFNTYFVSSNSKTSISWFVQIFATWIFLYYFYKKIYMHCIKTNDKKITKDKNLILFSRGLNAIVLLVTTIAFLIFDRNFHRFLELGYMLLYIMFSYYLTNLKLTNEIKLKYFSVILIAICLVTYMYTPFQTVIKPFFTYSGFHSLFMN